jgi:hypothetical protein
MLSHRLLTGLDIKEVAIGFSVGVLGIGADVF